MVTERKAATETAGAGDNKKRQTKLKRKSDRHRLQPKAAVGAISTDPRPNAGTRFMVERVENEASTAQDQLWERSRRREVRLSFRQLAATSDKRWQDGRWEKGWEARWTKIVPEPKARISPSPG